ncbi:MAG: hypothetical protein KGJ84_06915 [Elusimicrobia bacterium]|nr:hypothetical protein [Elusimicrobiota bacterium]
MRTALLFACLLSAAGADAATITGGDYAGADLLPVNGDVLSGTFLNVRLFQLPSGTTVFAAAGAPLTIYAATIAVAGTLDASGRGQFGGSGGPAAGAGSPGFGGSATGGGGGAAGLAPKGGGGGAYGGAGGVGAGAGGGAGGAVYDSTGVFTSPISADDIFQGSGGAGGGGGSQSPGGSGANGGGSVYLEGSSITVTGAILVQGATAAATVASGFGTNPGAGGGGSGGGLLLRATGALTMTQALLNANGGNGGSAVDPVNSNTVDPGGGGGGGRIKVFARSAALTSVTFSTAAGSPGGSGGTGAIDPTPAAGAVGTVSFGVIASSPTGFAAAAVYVTSISWSWNAAPSFGDAPAASRAYRIFPATATAPLTAPEMTASSLTPGATVSGLTPNTTYFRFATAYSDWGDSLPSNSVSTHTLASAPAAVAFTASSPTSLTLGWTAGTPANPSYTLYEVQSALDSGFTAGLQDGFVAALSSSPVGLVPNTTYYLRARAVNLDGVPTDYAAAPAAATLALAPAAAAFGPVGVTSAAFSWSGGANPADTQYAAEVSSDNFFSLTGSSATLSTSATFFGLTPGIQYFFRAKALNRAGVASAYSAVISTRAGVLTDVSPPSAPGTPAADRAFSYDGTVRFGWSPALSSVGILDYELLIGSFPGGNDVFNGTVAVASYTAAGLATGKTYYAQVRARSNAGAVGPFSSVSVGVPVFVTAQAAPIPKPYAWPNPFNPAAGPVQIGFFLDAPADVVLRVYTLNGRLLRETSAHFGSAGNQVASWDGADGSGRRAAPGGYVVVLKHAGAADAQRVKVAVLY